MTRQNEIRDAALSTPPGHEPLAAAATWRIFTWDLSRVRMLLMRDSALNSAEAEERIAEYRKYMTVNTLPHLRMIFGEPSQRYWLNVRRICWGDGGGGNCS